MRPVRRRPHRRRAGRRTLRARRPAEREARTRPPVGRRPLPTTSWKRFRSDRSRDLRLLVPVGVENRAALLHPDTRVALVRERDAAEVASHGSPLWLAPSCRTTYRRPTRIDVTGSASSPTVSPGGSSCSFSSASSTPGTNASREVVSWRIVSVSPIPPKTTSWWATRPGRRTEWIGGLGSHARRSRLRGPRRRVALGLVMELDDLGTREDSRRLFGESHHQHRARSRSSARWKHGTPASCARASTASWSNPVVPITTGRLASRQRSTFADDGIGSREVDRRVDPVERPVPRIDDLVTRVDERGNEHRADLPPDAEERDPQAARATLDSKRRVDELDGSPEAVLVRPDSRGGEPARVEELAGERRDVVGADGVEPREHVFDRQQRSPVHRRATEPHHPVRRRLEREQQAPLEVLLRPVELVRANVARRRCPRAPTTAISRHAGRFSSRVPTYRPTCPVSANCDE